MLRTILRLLRIFNNNHYEDDDEYEPNITSMLLKFAVTVILISLIFGALVENDKYQAKHQIVQFHFICNENVCEIKNLSRLGNIISTVPVDISNVKNFSAQYEKVPNSNRSAYTIYAQNKDGTSFQLSPVYFINSTELINGGIIDYLNYELSQKPININIKSPNYR